MKRRMNKKGSLQDVVLVGIVLLFMAVTVLIGFKVTNELNTHIQGSDIVTTNGKEASATLVGHYPGVIDNTFLLLSMGLAIATLILAVMVRIHPIFIPLFIIGLVIVIFVSGVLSNIYQEMAANPVLSTEADQLVFISNILEFLPFLVGIIGIILMVVMYKLWSVNQF